MRCSFAFLLSVDQANVVDLIDVLRDEVASRKMEDPAHSLL